MEHQDRRSNLTKFYNNEFYTAIMDEDTQRIEDLSKKHGSNCFIREQDAAPGDLWKGFAVHPIHLAASTRRVKSIQSLLSAGADPELRDLLGRTALHLVIASWPRDLSSQPKTSSNFNNVLANMRTQAEDCLLLLCEHGANVNAEVQRDRHLTALHLSVHLMAPPAVHILVSHGADVNATDSGGMTSLHMAAGILHQDIIVSLIKEGADVNQVMKQSGNTPLHIAVVAAAMKSSNCQENANGCITELLEHGAEVNAVNNAGMTPLHEVCKMGNEELVDLLLTYGANIDKLSTAGESCLFLFLNHSSNVKNHSLLVKLLNLTSPLTVYNHKGQLPSTLMLPCFLNQRDQLLKLIQQPRMLRDICKRVIYLKTIHDKKEKLQHVLPQSLHDFVFNQWDEFHVSFVTDGEKDLYTNTFNIAPI